MRLLFCTILACSSFASAQALASADDFAITMERTGCLGNCPAYSVTIGSDGQVNYDGQAYVRISGKRKGHIPTSMVRRLARQFRESDFFHWEQPKLVCLDFPEVRISATLNGQSNEVTWGCNSPAKVLSLAAEIDKVARISHWVK